MNDKLSNEQKIAYLKQLARTQSGDNVRYSGNFFPDDPFMRKNYANWVDANVLRDYVTGRGVSTDYNSGYNFDTVNFEGMENPSYNSVQRQVLNDSVRSQFPPEFDPEEIRADVERTKNALEEIRKKYWEGVSKKLPNRGGDSFTESYIPTESEMPQQKTTPSNYYRPIFAEPQGVRSTILQGLQDPRVQLAAIIPDAYRRSEAGINAIRRSEGGISYPRQVLTNLNAIGDAFNDAVTLGGYDYFRYGPQYSPTFAAVIESLKGPALKQK